MSERITIAIDGFSSTGKSTVAKQLAKALEYIYVDSGAMYRAVTLFAMQKGLISNDGFDKENLLTYLNDITISFEYNPVKGFAEVYLNGINVEADIRTLEVSNFVSLIAEVSEVRKKLVEQQQQFGKNKGVVMDGRDIGTVVFPDAELKIFMTASAETRAQRRYEELKAKGEIASFSSVLKNIQERDFIDTNRDDSPLVQADDAILFDNSSLSIKQQFEDLLHLASEVISRKI